VNGLKEKATKNTSIEQQKHDHETETAFQIKDTNQTKKKK